jgi:uncharacterized protein YabN with tetrapyrrole methylase and pyrophosphatase domain
LRHGRLAVVGTGIAGPGQVTIEALAEIRAAQKVFFLVADPLTREWLRTLRPRAESLADAYAPGKQRWKSYAEMVERMLAPLRRGRSVCAVFYGHPGVFASPPHEAIRRAREEGHAARMLPGVSAEDCLFADLGLDPGEFGCQSFEATDFLLRRRRFDPTSLLVLWQVGLVGVEDIRMAALWSASGLAVLIETLLETYPRRHQVVVYEASTLPISPPKIERVALGELASAAVTATSTLCVPPLGEGKTDFEVARRLGLG